MLHKLLKYNLRAVYIPLSIFYFIALTCAIIGRIFQGYDYNLLLKIVHEFFSGAALGLCFGIIINNATRIWEYAKRDFYGDQSYLTHTLPISRPTLLRAKFCTILITTFTSLLIIALILFINYSPMIADLIQQFILYAGSTAEFVKYAILTITVLFLEIVFITQAGVTGIILGHKINNHKALMSFVFGFAIFAISNFITIIIILIWSLLDSDVLTVIHSSVADVTVVKLLCGSIVAYLVYIYTSFFIAQASLQRGIDIE